MGGTIWDLFDCVNELSDFGYTQIDDDDSGIVIE